MSLPSIRTATGWTSTAGMHVRTGTGPTGWQPVRMAFRYAGLRQVSENPPVFEHVWQSLGPMSAPTETPPAPQLQPYDQLEITARTECFYVARPADPSDPLHYHDRVIRYDVDGQPPILVTPSNRPDVRTWAPGTRVTASVAYSNSIGTGPFSPPSAEVTVTG
ncbi:MAG TPA: hypothetical protein VE913_03090 [Longimicrobium sp.]|nr:hypothetical protein [Longimicrobium sp.]